MIGVLSIDDLHRSISFEVSWQRPIDPLDRNQVLGVRVSDLMTWAPFTVKAETTLEHAARMLAAHRIGCLPVVDARQQLVGMLSETDAREARARGRAAREMEGDRARAARRCARPGRPGGPGDRRGRDRNARAALRAC